MKYIIYIVFSFFLVTNALAKNNNSSVIEVKIPVSVLTNKIKKSFKGTKIHLSNYGKKHGNSWYKGGGSYVKLPSALGNSKHVFSLPPVNKFPLRYYVNDINLKAFRVGTNKNRFMLKFYFEDSGTEVKGRCSGGGWKKIICAKGSDRAAPDIHMSNMIARVYLTPAVRNGSISFGKVSTSFAAKIRIGKTCGMLKKLLKKIKLGGDICSPIKNKIKKGVKDALYKSINKNNIRNSIAKALRNELSKRGVKKIVSARIQGNHIVVGFKIYATKL